MSESTWVRVDGGIVVDEETGEVVEGSGADAVEQFTKLALEAEQQRKEWDRQEKLYKRVLLNLGVEDSTTVEGRAVKRGGFYRASAPRALFDGSFAVQDLPWDKRAEIALECFKELDPALVEAMFEKGNLSAAVADAIVQRKRVANWVEVKAIRQAAAKLAPAKCRLCDEELADAGDGVGPTCRQRLAEEYLAAVESENHP